MAKKDKDFELRMQGMQYALSIAKEKGIDYLEADIKRRNFLCADIYIKSEQITNFWEQISENIYCNVLTTAMSVLNYRFGFGKKRLKDFNEYYEKAVRDTIELDYLGDQYVTILDYAVELNEKYDMGLDVDRIGAVQDTFEENVKMDLKHYKGIMHTLRINGYNGAANFMERRLKEKER